MKPDRFLPPMLAGTAGDAFDDPAWRFEVKWDGWRAVVSHTDRLQAWSRQGRDLSVRFPGLVELAASLTPPVVVDGELLGVDAAGRPDFAVLYRRRPRWLYVVFDCLYDGSGWLIERPLWERLEHLRRAAHPGPLLMLADGVEGQGRRFYAAVCQSGLEGVMAKRLDSAYRPGVRTDAWLKILAWHEQTMTVVGVRPRAEGLSLVVAEPGQARNHPCTVVPVPAELAARTGLIGSRVLIAARGRNPQGRLRHPRFQGWAPEAGS
jgi:ATP-dependent DNA ligase